MTAVSDAQATYVGKGRIVREYTGDFKGDAAPIDAYGPDDGFATLRDATDWVARQASDHASVIVDQGKRFVPLHLDGPGSTMSGNVTHTYQSGSIPGANGTSTPIYSSYTTYETEHVGEFAFWNPHAQGLVTADGKVIGRSKQGDVHSTERHTNGVLGGVVGATLLGLGGAMAAMGTYGMDLDRSGWRIAGVAGGALLAGAAAGYLAGWLIGRQIG